MPLRFAVRTVAQQLSKTHAWSAPSRSFKASAGVIGSKLFPSDVQLQASCTWTEGVESSFKHHSMEDIFKGKKVAVVGVPGAFTGVCSQQIPEYAAHANDFKQAGVDQIVCVSVNDAYCMQAWKDSLKVNDEVIFFADHSGGFTTSLGQALDNLGVAGLGPGVRSMRYAMIVDDGEVKHFFPEEAASHNDKSKASNVLSAIKK